jgi:hypothetical protein
MATSSSTRLSSPVQSLPTNVSSILTWTLLKRLCGHHRGYFGEGPASLPVEPSCPSGPVLSGKEVCHV